MKISKDRIYFLYEDNKIKTFIITDIGDKVVVRGYIQGEGVIHNRGVSWLQEDPEKLKKKYRSAMKYYKRYGNKHVGILKDNFPSVEKERIKKEVIIIEVNRNFKWNTSGVLVSYIQANGIVSSADIGWFTNIK